MKLREFKFNELKSGNPDPRFHEGCVGLSIMDGDKEYMGFIVEVLEQVIHLAD